MKKVTKLLITCSLLGSFLLASCSPTPENNVVQTQDRNIVSINVKEGSVPDKIYVGEFDNAGIKLVISYSDNTSEEIDVTSAMLAQQYKTAIQTPGVYTIEIFYRKQIISLKINIVPKDLTVNYYAYVDKNEYVLIDSQIIPYRHDAVEPTVVNDFYFGDIHYYFRNWDVKSNDIRLNTDIYAQYDEINYYTVSFFDGNGTVISTQKVDKGQNAEEPTAEMRDVDGFKFIGWDRSYLNVNKDLSIYGMYKKVSSVIPATEVTLNGGKSIIIGENYVGELPYTSNSPDMDSSELVWKSSNNDVVTVENGIITAHSQGLAVISIANDYISAKCSVNVVNLGTKENPITIQEAAALYDRAFENNATIIQKAFIRARVQLTTSYSSPGGYRIRFLDYNSYSFTPSDPYVSLDESVTDPGGSLDVCYILFESWGYKADNGYYYFDYSPSGETEYIVIHGLEYPDLESLTSSSSQKIALSLYNTPNGYDISLGISPYSAVLSHPLSWTIENESIISIETSGDFATNCRITPLAIGKTKLTASYKEISYEYNIIVDNFGSNENPLSVSDYLQIKNNNEYSDYQFNSIIVEGEIIKVANGYTLGGEDENFMFWTNEELLLGSLTKIDMTLRFYGAYESIERSIVLSSTGGRERAIIPATPSEALQEAKKLARNETSYDYYEITGYISYKTSDDKYSYLSDTQVVLDEEPDKAETFVIYRLFNHITNDKTPVTTKIKITTNLYYYNGTYYENDTVLSAEILEYAPTTDLIVQSSLMLVVGETRTVSVTPMPSYHIVDNVTYTWADETQQVASVDENGVVTGLSAGNAVLEVSYQNFTKSVSISVYESGSLEYVACTSIADYGIYLIACGNAFAKYRADYSRTGYYELEEGQDVRTMQLEPELEWEIAKVESEGETYYTIKNVATGLYLNKGNNGVTYGEGANMWIIEQKEDGTFEITNLEKHIANEYNRYLRYNKGYGFGCYSSSVGKTNTLYVKNVAA